MSNKYYSVEKVIKALNRRTKNGYKNHAAVLLRKHDERGDVGLYKAARKYGIVLPKKEKNRYTNREEVLRELDKRKNKGLENTPIRLMADDNLLYFYARIHKIELPRAKKRFESVEDVKIEINKLVISGKRAWKKEVRLSDGALYRAAKKYNVDFPSPDIGPIVDKIYIRRGKYIRITDSMEATRRLLIYRSSEYPQYYRFNPMLPARPQDVYKNEWKGWPTFLGHNYIKYHTKDEIRKSIKKHRMIASRWEYKLYYKEDPCLPALGWIDNNLGKEVWYYLLTGNEKIKEYETYKEASMAAIRLNIRTIREYKARYKEDPRLPAHPERKYENDGWEGWAKFLGKNTQRELVFE